MLVTILISAAFISGVIFGWFCATELKKRQKRRERQTILGQKPTALLEEDLRILTEELNKRGTTQVSPFR